MAHALIRFLALLPFVMTGEGAVVRRARQEVVAISSKGHIRGKATAKTQGSPPIFYYVAMGDIASSHLMKTMVLSLRKKGEYRGPVVMVTDRLKCLVQNLGNEVLGNISAPVGDPEKTLVFKGTHGSYHIVIAAPPRSRSAKAIMGTQIFEQHKALARIHAANANLPFEVGTVIVIDEDILVTQPVKPFFDHIASSKTDANDLAVFQDQGHSHAWFHCGLVVSYPGSDHCMTQWVKEDIRQMRGWAVPEAFSFLEGSSLLELSSSEQESVTGPGQKAFSSTQCAKAGRVKHLSSSFLSFPTQESVAKNASTLFIHFSNQYRMRDLFGKRAAKQKVQDFIRNFVGLDSDIMSNDNCTDFELFRYVKDSTPGHGAAPPQVNEVEDPSHGRAPK